MNFIAELRRRNVIRMAGLYLVVAWLIVQVAETVLPAFDVPGWVLRAIILVLAIGFVPALIFSWLFEFTPEGLKRDADVDPAQSIAPVTAKRMDTLTLGAVALLLVVIAANRYWPSAPPAPSPETETVARTGDPSAPASGAVPPNSIAVLPFVNMSSDPEQEYFSDGISEEILNVLARVPGLQVAARTSSFSFKGGKQEVPEIAQALQVRLVLEGSVRKQGDQVRITAQLIDATTGFHLWSETFDRELKDIFRIQDEIAQAIADALKVNLGTALSGVGDDAHAPDLQAHDLYLRSLALWQTRGEEELWQAVDLLKQAITIDPDYAQAHAGLALVYGVIAGYSARITYADANRLARNQAEVALALDPRIPEPFVVLGYLANIEARRDTAQKLFQRGIALGPSYATAHQWQGTALMSAGRLDEALAVTARALELDPLSRVIVQNHAQVLLSLGRNKDAVAACEKAFEFAPEYFYCLTTSANAYLYEGDFESARGMTDRLVAAQKPASKAFADRLYKALRGDGDRRAMAEELASYPRQSSFDLDSPNLFDEIDTAPLLVILGAPDLALDYLERMVDSLGGAGNIDWSLVLPAMDPVRCEPRFIALAEKLKTHDPYFQRVCGAKP
ncbi:MAG: hypothetical protein DCF27_05670 [Lysobacteraceae bacterium]|nr:MAG: hypothetical protein DCF27_05670 [Xanthomonadaceae bacterium]